MGAGLPNIAPLLVESTVQSFVRPDRAMPGADPWVPHTSIHTENGHRERQGRAKWNHKFGPDSQPDDAPHPYYTSLSQDLPDSVLRADPSTFPEFGRGDCTSTPAHAPAWITQEALKKMARPVSIKPSRVAPRAVRLTPNVPEWVTSSRITRQSVSEAKKRPCSVPASLYVDKNTERYQNIGPRNCGPSFASSSRFRQRSEQHAELRVGYTGQYHQVQDHFGSRAELACQKTRQIKRELGDADTYAPREGGDRAAGVADQLPGTKFMTRSSLYGIAPAMPVWRQNKSHLSKSNTPEPNAWYTKQRPATVSTIGSTRSKSSQSQIRSSLKSKKSTKSSMQDSSQVAGSMTTGYNSHAPQQRQVTCGKRKQQREQVSHKGSTWLRGEMLSLGEITF